MATKKKAEEEVRPLEGQRPDDVLVATDPNEVIEEGTDESAEK